MKKINFTLLIAFFLLLGSSLSAQNNSHLITYQPYSPCAGSPVLFSATDTSNTFLFADMYWDFGDGGFGYSNSGSPTVSHTYTTPGTYNIVFLVFDSLSNNQDTIYFPITVDSICANSDMISGVSYLDANANGSQDPGEPVLPNTIITITPGPFTFTTDQNGGYGVSLNAGTYTLSPQTVPYYTITEPVSASYTVTSTGNGQSIPGNDFGFSPLPGINDLRITAYSIPPVPGFTRQYSLVYHNDGTAALNANIVFQYDPQMTFSAVGNNGVHSGNTITWNLGLVNPGQSGIVTCALSTPVSQTVGTFLNSVATINPVTGDSTPGNNVDSLSQEVLASYDPNDKAAVPAGAGPTGDIAPGTELTYTIRFQNTGNFMATNVVLMDTLDADFDYTTLEVLGSSHPMTWHLNNGELVFDFSNIMLPDSNSNEPASHGWAQYKIAHKSSLPLGSELTNSASIYFDFNAPILTNTTLHTLSIAIAVDEAMNQLEMTVAPHPVLNQAEVTFDNPSSLRHDFTLVDIQGKVVREVKGIEGNSFILQRNNLPAGMYLFNLQNDQGSVATGKIVIQ